MSTKHVVFVEFPIFAGVLPLASGYLEAYARKDAALADLCRFEKISLPVKSSAEQVVAALEAATGDVYAFSCYVWNMGLVRRVLRALRMSRPDAHFILGGPQVMHQAARYLQADMENVYVCNGEGERTFSGFLRALWCGGDMAAVRGLSFYREGALITTEPEPRITDLAEVPSPFLEGLFEPRRYAWALIETNRGCPFRCNYCYWGAATGARVFKYDDQRLERELEWIAKSGCLYLFIADANWGMLKRDLDLTRYIVECQKQHGSPMWVYFCGSKNTPDRVAEISRTFHAAGMIATQSVALQTLNTETLKKVNRDNIKLSAYAQIQRTLNDEGISSFVEMIWPLPGETLESFREGLAQLCDSRADSFLVYPLLLMNNVELAQKRDEYGLITVDDPDPNSEAEMVVGTREVTRADYEEGIRYMYAITALYTLRGLWHLGRYLKQSGGSRYVDLFRAFAEYSRHRPDASYSRFCAASIEGLATGNFSNIGELVHLILHEDREGFDQLLDGFVRSQSFWQDPAARCMFELDVVSRPYIYFNTPIREKPMTYEFLHVASSRAGYVIRVPPDYASALAGEAGAPCPVDFAIEHRRSQLPLMPRKSAHENYMYCQDMTQRMREIVPLCSPVQRVAAAV